MDGSGLELLSSQAVEEELRQARSDPAVALLKEPLPDPGARFRTPSEVLNTTRVTPASFPGGFGITILRPARGSLWSQWTLGKKVPEITPPNLRNRSWAGFPRTEVRRLWSRATSVTPNPHLQPSPPEEDSRSWVWAELWKRGVWSEASTSPELP